MTPAFIFQGNCSWSIMSIWHSVKHGLNSNSIIICQLVSTSSRSSLMVKHNVFFCTKTILFTALYYDPFTLRFNSFSLTVIIVEHHVRWFIEPIMMLLPVLAAGKISRRVSLIHYPEPSELKQNSINLKQMMAQRSSATTLTNSTRRFATPTQSTRTRSIMQSGSSSKSTKRKHGDGGPAKSNYQSVQDSGKSGHSALTSSGSFDQSQDQKSKKKRKIVGWSVVNRILFG